MKTETAPPNWAMFRLQAQDTDQLNHAVSGSNLEVSQFRRGAFQSELSQYAVGPVRFDHGTVGTSVRVRGELAAREATLSFFRRASGSQWNGRAAPTTSVAYFEPGGELDGATGDDFEWVTMVIPPDWVESAKEWAPSPRAPRMVDTLRMLYPEEALMEEFQSVTHTILGQCVAAAAGHAPPARAQAFMLQRLRDVIGEVITEKHLPKEEWGGIGSYTQMARRAEYWMRERLGEPIGIDDVCAAVHVKRRSLEYAFRHTFDTSPSEHLRILRLNEVRKALRRAKAGSTSVTDEAMRYGFFHLGIFAQRYKAHFGESPSVTLRKAIGARYAA